MTLQVAFLRAINVGGHTVTMVELRRLFVDAGFAQVETYIQSGNIIFLPPTDGAAVEAAIEAHLQRALGYPVTTFVRSLSELAEIAACDPFPPVPSELETTRYVAFLKAEPDAAARSRLAAQADHYHDFHVAGREVYWLRRRLPGEPPFSSAFLEKALAAPVTVRNVTTLTKIVAKYSPEA